MRIHSPEADTTSSRGTGAGSKAIERLAGSGRKGQASGGFSATSDFGRSAEGLGQGGARRGAWVVDLWVFGYGSLMWRPGFPHVERRHASLYGYHRSLCVLSHVHRGTPERPGLVLGLDRGGRCLGVAFRVAAREAEATVAYLRGREQVTAVYLERRLPIRLDDGRRVEALAYAVDRRHPQYAGALSED